MRNLSNISREQAKREVGSGWSALIDEVYDNLPEGVTVYQVKEKFGGLRVYAGPSSEELENLLVRAENKSYTTCESCGGLGGIRSINSWVRVLCKSCYERYT